MTVPTFWIWLVASESVGTKMGNLTAMAVKAALANPGTYQDGDGLFLKVKKSGGAYWNLRVQQDGKRRDIGIGSAKLLTLADARHKAAGLRRAIKVDHCDVLAEKKDDAAAKVTFRAAATQYRSENEAGWKSTVYARQWLASLENYAFPKLGDMPTGSITSADIITVLTPIWQEIPDTTRQVRNRICTVLDYSHAKGWRARDTFWQWQPEGGQGPAATGEGKGQPQGHALCRAARFHDRIAAQTVIRAVGTGTVDPKRGAQPGGPARDMGRVRSGEPSLDDPCRAHEAEQGPSRASV